MTVLFEDYPDSALVLLYKRAYSDIDIRGVGGHDNIIKNAAETKTLAYVDIGFDNKDTVIAFNDIVGAEKVILPVPIPNMEYMYLLLCKQYGMLKNVDVCNATLKITSYSSYNSFKSRNFENFCKAVTRNCLSSCARLFSSCQQFPRLFYTILCMRISVMLGTSVPHNTRQSKRL